MNSDGCIEKNPNLIRESPKLIKRQLGTPVGTIDLLFDDKNGHLIVVELKIDKIARPFMEELVEIVNETVGLNILNNDVAK